MTSRRRKPRSVRPRKRGKEAGTPQGFSRHRTPNFERLETRCVLSASGSMIGDMDWDQDIDLDDVEYFALGLSNRAAYESHFGTPPDAAGDVDQDSRFDVDDVSHFVKLFQNPHPQPSRGSIHGVKWLDGNGNGQRDGDEPGVSGIVIYSDRNFNGSLDDGEPHTVTMADLPETDFDESGRYWLEELRPGLHAIREVLPGGFEQTFPGPNPEPAVIGNGSPHRGGAHVVQLGSGATVEGIDFGNRPIEPGSIHGLKWLDRDGNGQRDADEPGLAGVVIYSDRNFNGRLDRGEPHTRTMEDIPETDFDEAGMYWLEKLRPGLHAIREILPDGFEQTFPSPNLILEGLDDGSLHRRGAHVVWVGSGVNVEGIDFGNRPIEPGSIHGLKWLDRNGNGERDGNEPGLAGVVIYSDRNFNGRLDRGEPHTRTMEDIPETDFDEAGMYWLEKLRPGRQVIREVVPEGFQQTFPAPILAIAGLDDGSPHRGGAHVVRLGSGATVEGIDFGNRPIERGSVHGVKWLDRDGDGQRDSNEPGLAGVVIYSDRNFNGRLDRGEPHTRTMEDIPETDFDEAGMYWLEKLRPGRHVIREVVPEGFQQTFPAPILAIAGLDDGSPHRGGAHVVRLGWGATVEGIDFGNRPIEPGSIHGLKWLDRNGNGERDANEPGLAGVVIYSDRNFNGQLDRGEPHTRTMEDIPETDFDEAGMYWLEKLRPGRHVIREVVPEGFQQTFPAPILAIAGLDDGSPHRGGAHVVRLGWGATVEGIDFGNRPIEPGSIHGLKWLDRNGNGERDGNEPGLAGVVIYSDRNFNGRLDRGEPHTRTMEDIPETDFDEAGMYWLEKLRPGRHAIREVVPEGFQQTFPAPILAIAGLDDGSPHRGGAHVVRLGSGATVEGIDFGNRPIEPGSVHGLKWLDRNGNGERDANEPGLPGVVIYSDRNFNGQLDRGEPHTRTMEDIPETDFDEAGMYWLEKLRPGRHVIREVVPDGFQQTFPAPILAIAGLDDGSPHRGGAHVVRLGWGATVEGIDFGNRPIEPGSVHGLKWLDRNGNGERDANEPGLPGVVIYSDRNFNGQLDRGEPHTRTMEDIPETDFDEAGMYWLEKLRPGRHVIREVVPDGFQQTFPAPILAIAGLDDGSPHRGGAHVVRLGSGATVEGIDFGNRPIEPGSIHGLKWLDRNGNGERDANEPGLPGVVIYSDRNFNGRLDRGEPHTRTMEDIPETDFDEAGMYWLGELRPGRHVIREVVPQGFEQTFPAREAPSFVEVTDGEVAGDPGEFITVSPREIHETVAAGELFQTDVSLTVHPFCVRPFKVDVVASDPDVPFENLTGVELNDCGGDTTSFHIQIVGDGRTHRFELHFVDTEFAGVLAEIPVTIRAGHDGGHLVVVTSGSAIEGIDFGNRERLVLPGDLNRDGQVQADDAEALVLSLVDPRSYEGLYGLPGNGNGDIDGDRVFDLDDIEEFSKLLFGRQLDEDVLAAALESVLEHDAPLGRLL